MLNSKLIAIAFSTLCLAACATDAPKLDAVRPEQLTGETISVLPLTSARDRWGVKTLEGVNFAGAYTRMVITSNLQKSPTKKYGTSEIVGEGSMPYTPATGINRAISAVVGRTFTTALTVKLSLGSDLIHTVPLAVLSHSTSGKGDSWERDVNMGVGEFPLFLVRNDGAFSIPNIIVELSTTLDYDSRGVATGISALTKLATVGGIESSLITELTKSATKANAEKLDSAISSLMRSSITERIRSDRFLSMWRSRENKTDDSEPLGLEVSMRVPIGENPAASEYHRVGTWTISFSAPRPSAFSSLSICDGTDTPRCSHDMAKLKKMVLVEVKNGEVLAYPLIRSSRELGTISTFLKSRGWWEARNSSPAVSDTFCKNIVSDIVSLGFNHLDSQLVLRAVLEAMPAALPKTTDAPSCTPDFNEKLTTS